MNKYKKQMLLDELKELKGLLLICVIGLLFASSVVFSSEATKQRKETIKNVVYAIEQGASIDNLADMEMLKEFDSSGAYDVDACLILLQAKRKDLYNKNCK